MTFLCVDELLEAKGGRVSPDQPDTFCMPVRVEREQFFNLGAFEERELADQSRSARERFKEGWGWVFLGTITAFISDSPSVVFSHVECVILRILH